MMTDTLIAGLYLILGFAMLLIFPWITLSLYRQFRRNKKNGIAVQAVVKEVLVESGDRTNITPSSVTFDKTQKGSYRPVFVYTILDGTEIESEHNIAYATQKFKAGDKVQVFYDATKPDLCLAPGDTKLTVVLLAILIPLCVLCVIMLIQFLISAIGNF